jgi:hypothetical protein
VNFLLPDRLEWRMVDQRGKVVGDGQISWTPERLLGSEAGSKYWEYDLGRLVPHGALYKVHFIGIAAPPPGTYGLKCVLVQSDLLRVASGCVAGI